MLRKTAFVMLGIILMAGVAHAQSSNQKKQNTNQSQQNTKMNKPTNYVNTIRLPDPPSVSTGTATGTIGQPASSYHPPAASSMKSVDTKKVPPPGK